MMDHTQPPVPSVGRFIDSPEHVGCTVIRIHFFGRPGSDRLTHLITPADGWAGVLTAEVGGGPPANTTFRLITMRWELATAACKCVARTVGAVNRTTGQERSAGLIVSGWSVGASVMHLATLIDTDPYTSKAT